MGSSQLKAGGAIWMPSRASTTRQESTRKFRYLRVSSGRKASTTPPASQARRDAVWRAAATSRPPR